MDFPSRCQRCKEDSQTYKMSFFNTDWLCEGCETKERQHPMYLKAKEEELKAVKKGDYNYPGIGKPKDL